MSIAHLEAGNCATVSGFHRGSRAYKQRLLAMGLVPGTQFQIGTTASDMIEIILGNLSLVLRRSEAAMIQISQVNS
jgi:ferrous iron transport protein A